MASLMENMIEVLQDECREYEELCKLSKEKTSIIVAGDLPGLEKMTEAEQEVVGRINKLEKKRLEVTSDIANVMNMDPNNMKVRDLIPLLASRPTEQKKLQDTCDKLQKVVGEMKTANEQNGELIKHSLEMVEFDLNLLQAMKGAPETANYGRGAYNTGSQIGNVKHGFDAKQ